MVATRPRATLENTLGEHQYRRSEPGQSLRSAPAGNAGAAESPLEPLTHVEPVPVRVRFAVHVADGPWQIQQWRPVSVEPADPTEPGTVAIEVFTDEAEGYYLNLTSGDPSIMVRWRLPEDETGVAGQGGEPQPLAITLSYNEAGRWMDGGERVDPVPMPAEIQEWLAEFVRLHYRPETKHKQRGPKPSFMRRDEFADMIERERRRLQRAAAEAGTNEGRPGAADTASRADGNQGG